MSWQLLSSGKSCAVFYVALMTIPREIRAFWCDEWHSAL